MVNKQKVLEKLYSLRRFYSSLSFARTAGLRDQIAFWERWFQTHGLDWPEEYLRRLDPKRLLSERLQACLKHLPDENVRILDVGAGPLTALGSQHPTKRLDIIAIDVLAPHYDRLLKRHRITPPVRTIYGDAEALTTYYPESHFDLVQAQNSIDQTRNPLLVIQQMIQVVKEDCFVALEHEENKGEKQHYTGIHQWNFTKDGNAFLIWRGKHMIDVSQAVQSVAEVNCDVASGWVNVRIRKHARGHCG